MRNLNPKTLFAQIKKEFPKGTKNASLRDDPGVGGNKFAIVLARACLLYLLVNTAMLERKMD